MIQAAHILAVGVLILTMHVAAWGQPSLLPNSPSVLPSEGYVHTSWGTDEGLPSSDAWPILQDRAGYIWVGTGFGAVRFDGSRFAAYNTRTTPVIRGQEVRAIHEDRKGRIWIGIMNAGVVIYEHGEFFTPSWADSFTYRTVTGIFADSTGSTYLCTTLGAYAVRNDSIRKITTLPELPRSGFTRPDGTVFFVGQTLVRYEGPFHRSSMVLPLTPQAFSINDVLFEGDTLMYVVRLGEIRRFAVSPDHPPVLEATFHHPGIVKMLKDGKNGYFVGTVGYGVIYFDGELFSYPQGLGVQRGAGRQVHALMRGREGDLWATTSGGLYRFSRTFFTILGADAGFTQDYAWLVHLQQEHTLWIGVGLAGTYRFDGSTLRLLGKKDGMPDDHLSDMFESADGTMWFGGVNGELSSYKNGVFRRYGADGARARGRIQSISEDAQHRIWLGTRQGLYMMDKGRFTSARLADGSPIPAVRNLVHMPDGSIWCIASAMVGHLQNGILRTYAGTPDSGFYGATAMLVDTGRVWFGTYGGGLYMIAGDSVINVNKVHSAFGPRILSILEDHLGFLWINAERELQRVRKADLLAALADTSKNVFIDVFDHRDGLADLEFNMASDHSAQKLPDGRILYASTSGIVAMNPLIVSRPTSPPPVVIERIIADDVAYYGEETVSLPAGTRRIQIDFSALRFNSMGRVVFRYRLGGVDKDWIQRPGSQNSATYTNPGPGDLWFTIAASVNGGPWSERPATLRITVGRYFYQEPWLQVAGGLALIGLVVGAYRWRTRRVRERNRQLEAEVQRRIEAETKIRTSLDEKTVMLKEIHHRVKNNLQIISSLFSLQFGSSNDPMVQEMLKESQTRIRSMALVHEALYRSNNLAAIDFREYVQGLAAQIAHTHQRGNVRIQFAGEPITLSLDQAIPAGLIMNEALSNAYKHAFPGNGEGVITVHFRNDEDAHVELAVSDTGRGLPEGFDPSAVPSLGFHLILALTEQLSGTLSINGKPGTRIAVRFPVV